MVSGLSRPFSISDDDPGDLLYLFLMTTLEAVEVMVHLRLPSFKLSPLSPVVLTSRWVTRSSKDSIQDFWRLDTYIPPCTNSLITLKTVDNYSYAQLCVKFLKLSILLVCLFLKVYISMLLHTQASQSLYNKKPSVHLPSLSLIFVCVVVQNFRTLWRLLW